MIVVRPGDPTWPELFRAERAELERLLAPWLDGGVHHIGSTAVPGLAAKPVLDMMAGVADLDDARAAVPVLAVRGYVHAPHRPEALWFRRDTDGTRSHQLHLTVPGSALWRERLAFRDALRADTALAEAYAELKRTLAAHHDDLADYTAGKRAFVARVLDGAGITLTPRRR